MVKGDQELEPYPLYWAYRLQSAGAQAAHPVARFEKGLSLLQASAELDSTRRDELAVTLEWAADSNLAAEYKVFVHIVTSDGIIAQADAFPAHGTFPTTWWRSGDQIVDVHEIALPVLDSTETFQVMAGMYQKDNQERLAVLDMDGRPIGDSVILDLRE